MKAKGTVAPTEEGRKKRELAICDAVGRIAHEVGVIETLANAASSVAGRRGDDKTCRRRLGDLVVQIERTAREALESARALDEEVNPGALH